MDLELVKAWFSSTSRDEGRRFIEELCQIPLFVELLEEWSGSLLAMTRQSQRDAVDARNAALVALEGAAQSQKQAVEFARQTALQDAALTQQQAEADVRQAASERDAALAALEGSVLTQQQAVASVRQAALQEAALTQQKAEEDVRRATRERDAALAALEGYALTQRKAEADIRQAALQEAALTQQQAEADVRQATRERDAALAALEGSALTHQQAEADVRQAARERDAALASLEEYASNQKQAVAFARQVALQEAALTQQQTAADVRQVESERDAALAALEGSTLTQQQAVAFARQAALQEAALTQQKAVELARRVALQEAALTQQKAVADARQTALQEAALSHKQAEAQSTMTRLTTDGDIGEEHGKKFLQIIKRLLQERESTITCQFKPRCTLSSDIVPISRPGRGNGGQFDAAYLNLKIVQDKNVLAHVQLRFESKGGQNGRTRHSPSVVQDLSVLRSHPENANTRILLAFINWNQPTTEPQRLQMSEVGGVLVFDHAQRAENFVKMQSEVLIWVQCSLIEYARADEQSKEVRRKREAEKQFSDNLTDLTCNNVLQGAAALSGYDWGTAVNKRMDFWFKLLKVFSHEELLQAVQKIVKSKAINPVWTEEFREKLRKCFSVRDGTTLKRRADPQKALKRRADPQKALKRRTVTRCDETEEVIPPVIKCHGLEDWLWEGI